MKKANWTIQNWQYDKNENKNKYLKKWNFIRVKDVNIKI